MPIPDIAQPAGDIIRDALDQAHELGRMPSTRERFHHGNACTHLLQQLDGAGFEIVRKGAPQEGVVRVPKSDAGRVETRVPEGSPRALKHQLYQNAIRHLRGPSVPAAEVVAMALGDASPDGAEGNVWRLFDQRLQAKGYTVVSEEVDKLEENHERQLRNDPAYRLKYAKAVRDGFKADREAQEARAATRDFVLFDCEDYEGNEAAANALGLDSYPLDAPVTLGWLVDEHAAFKQALEKLIWDLTNGCVSKPNTDLDVVHELAGKAFVVNLLDDHPELAADPLFRPAMEKHFSRGETEAQVEIARLRLDGHRVVRIGAAGTFDLGKAVV